jgi:HlyD family secretion protein
MERSRSAWRPAPQASAKEQVLAGKQWLIRLSLVVVAIVVGVVVWRFFASRNALPDNVIAVSGRIEGDDSAIASKQPGRIVAIRYREGDSVRAGDVIATLDDAQAKAAVADYRARLQAATRQTSVMGAQLQQAQLSTGQAAGDVAGGVAQAESTVAAAQADLARAQSAYQLAEDNERRDVSLYATGDIAGARRDQSVSTAQQAAAAVEAARHQVGAAQGALEAARANNAEPPIRQQQANAAAAQISTQHSAIGAAMAQLAQAEANEQDLTVRAPFNGTVMVRAAEPGEVLAAGTPIVTLLNLDKVYLRAFVPEEQIGHVVIGQPARVYLDSDPTHPLDAYVMRIDPQAMFTPENTYFRSDRVKEVFGVKLALRSGFGQAKPGMPADGEILVSGQWPR